MGVSDVGSEVVVAVDLGTSCIKAGVIDEEGNVLATAVENAVLYHRGEGWVEQDPEQLYVSTLSVIKRLVSKSEIPADRVACVSIDAQMAGLIGIDSSWNALTPYDSWLDTRCTPYILQMERECGRDVVESSGCPPTIAYGPKVLWWKNEHPATFQQVAKFLPLTSYISGRLCGLTAKDAFMDFTHLHFTSLACLGEGVWSSRLCAALGIKEDKLPEIVKPWDMVGRLGKGAANECGLAEGTPVTAGIGDTAASVLGAGVVQSGMVLDMAGTACSLLTCTEDFTPDTEHRVFMVSRSAVPGLYHVSAYVNGGGECLRWLAGDVYQGDRTSAPRESAGVSLAELDLAAAKVPPGAGSLLFLPYFGGRIAPPQPFMRGAYLGLTWSHGREHLYRSVLEGIAYEYSIYIDLERTLFPSLAFREIRVAGGGARSQVWNQMKADILGIPYATLDKDEIALIGSALIGAYSVGLIQDLQKTALRWTRVNQRLAPRPEIGREYSRYAIAYRKAVEALIPVFAELSELRKAP
ncbi:MAG: xylulokinase [Clostridia bacterium]